MKRGMSSGGHRRLTAFILWPSSPSKKSPLDPPSPWSWLGAYSDVREKIYSGVEVSEIVKQTEYYKHIGVCSDLLKLLTKECGCDANIGKICRIVGGYMEEVSEVAI